MKIKRAATAVSLSVMAVAVTAFFAVPGFGMNAGSSSPAGDQQAVADSGAGSSMADQKAGMHDGCGMTGGSAGCGMETMPEEHANMDGGCPMMDDMHKGMEMHGSMSGMEQCPMMNQPAGDDAEIAPDTEQP